MDGIGSSFQTFQKKTKAAADRGLAPRFPAK
jgi:hypothetical protein